MTLPVIDEAIIVMADTRYGRIAHVREDDPIGSSLQQYGEWAQLEIDFLLQFVGAGDTVVDAGANVGTHTLAFAQATGPGGRVLSFEPQREIFELLRRNVAANGAEHVVIRRCALGCDADVAYVPRMDYASRLNTGAVALLDHAAGAEDEVEVLPLDALSLPALRLVKIDVEGMEADVIHGARDTLARCRPLLFVECNTLASGTATWEALCGARYAVYFKRSAAFDANNFRGNLLNRFGAARESNLFCIPQELEQSLARALANEPELFRIDRPEDLAVELLRTPRYGDGAGAAPAAGAAGDADVRALRAQVAQQRGEIERLAYRLAKRAHADQLREAREERRAHEERQARDERRAHEDRAAEELRELRGRLDAAEANAHAAAAAEARQRTANEELAARLATAEAEAAVRQCAEDEQREAREQREERAAEELRELRGRLDAAEANAHAGATAVAQHRTLNEELAARLATAQAEAATRETALAADVGRLGDELSAARRQLETAAENTAVQAAANESRAAQLEARVRALDDELSAAAQRIEQLGENARGAQARYERVATELGGAEHRAVQAHTDLVAVRAMLAENARRRDALEEQVRQRTAELQSAARHAEACRLDVERLQSDVRSRDALIGSVLGSRSWRLTAPLRRFKRLLLPQVPQENG